MPSIGGATGATTQIATYKSSAACGVCLELGTQYLMIPNVESSLAREIDIPSIELCGLPYELVTDRDVVDDVLRMTAVIPCTWAIVQRGLSETPGPGVN